MAVGSAEGVLMMGARDGTAGVKTGEAVGEVGAVVPPAAMARGWKRRRRG